MTKQSVLHKIEALLKLILKFWKTTALEAVFIPSWNFAFSLLKPFFDSLVNDLQTDVFGLNLFLKGIYVLFPMVIAFYQGTNDYNENKSEIEQLQRIILN